MAEDLLDKAQQLHQQGLIDEAIDAYQQAIAHPQQRSQAYRQLDKILFNLEKLEESTKNYQKIVELAPQMAHPYFRLGQVYKKRQQWADAIDYYQQAIALNPKNSWFYKELGELYLTQEQFDKAEDSFQKSLELKPDMQDTYRKLGIAQQKQEKLEDAIVSFQSLLELNSNHLGVNQRLGDLYAQKKMFGNAIAHYRSVIEISNDNPFLHAKLARALQSDGQFEQAIGAWHSAIQLEDDRYQFHEQLGDLLLQQEDVEGAIASYERAISLNPDLSDLRRKLNTALQKQTIIADPREPKPSTVSTPASEMAHTPLDDTPQALVSELDEQPVKQSGADANPENIKQGSTEKSGTSPTVKNDKKVTELEIFNSSRHASEERHLGLQEMPIDVDLNETIKHGKGGGASGNAPFSKHKRRGPRNATVDKAGFTGGFSFSAEGVGGYDENIPKPVKKILLFCLLGFYGAIALTLFLKGLTILGILLVAIAALILLIFWGFRKLQRM